MRSPDSEISARSNSAVAAQPIFWGQWWIRIAVFVLHIAVLAAAISLTPSGFSYQLGYYAGSILFLGSIFLWCLLLAAKTRRGIFLFGILALGQAGFVVLVGLHFRAEDRLLQTITEEFAMKKSEWASQMEHFRMDPLFETISGKRQLSVRELWALQIRARSGKAKLGEIHSDSMRSIAEAESRIAAVSAEEARNFRRGVESTQSGSDEGMKLMQDYFTDIEQLTGFLIDRQGQYSQTSRGVVFKREADARAFNEQLDAIAHLQEQLKSAGQGLTPH